MKGVSLEKDNDIGGLNKKQHRLLVKIFMLGTAMMERSGKKVSDLDERTIVAWLIKTGSLIGALDDSIFEMDEAKTIRYTQKFREELEDGYYDYEMAVIENYRKMVGE